MIPTYAEALELVSTYNHEPFHIRHAETVAGVMGYFAALYDPGNSEFWKVVGLLHDIDFELHPEEHCIAGEGLLRKHDIDESIIRSAMSHSYGVCATPYKPTHIMEKVLFATDELTGLIGAVALMRPSKSVQDLELKSVLKKFKQPSFAAGCSREVITQGAEMLGWSLDDLITRTIQAMRTLEIK
jgi:predicted hydrolase (HD superfamily)